MERVSKISANIPGTIYNGQTGQFFVSSGIQALDSVIGGGLTVGTVTSIEEDIYGSYAKVMLDYFLAEGIVRGHSTIVASLDADPHHIVKNLPSPTVANATDSTSVPQDGKMQIAFRYQNLPVSAKESYSIGHNFDLSQTISPTDVENSDICYWSGQRFESGPCIFTNLAFNELLKSIKNKITEGKFFLKDNPNKRNILRIGIHSLGSPLWSPTEESKHLRSECRDLELFVFCLRALMRSAYAVAVITIPSHLYYENSLNRIIHSSDIAMRLQTFSGTELENNRSLSDYHGFLHFTKMAPMNTFVSKHPGSVEYVFKLRRKKFNIEKLHLPPDLQETSEPRSGLGCAKSNTNLEF